MARDIPLGNGHTMQYANGVLFNCLVEIYKVL